MSFLRLSLGRYRHDLRSDSWRTAALMIVALALLVSVAALSGAFRSTENRLGELTFALFGREASGQVHVVEMDAASMAAIRRWPWPRDHFARVVRNLDAAGVRSVSFDIDFSSSADPAGDAAFGAAIAQARAPVALPTFAQAAGFGDRRQLDSLPIPVLREHAQLASVSVAPDPDGYVRRLPFGTVTSGTARPSLSLTTGPVPMSIDENGVGYIMARTVTLSNPGGAILPVCVVRVKRGEPASIAYLSTEPVRRRSGELVELFVIAAAPDLNTSQAGSRFVWYTAIRNGATVICSLTDDGDPYIVFESQTSVGSPPLAIPQNLLPTSAPPGTPPVFIANARGDAALVISVGSAVIASPAVNFTCGDVDFNNDGVFPTDQDVVDFLDVFAGAPCPTLRCDTIDFNRDGASPQDQDVIDFFNVLAGGSCS
jgi:hypothetical protein